MSMCLIQKGLFLLWEDVIFPYSLLLLTVLDFKNILIETNSDMF